MYLRKVFSQSFKNATDLHLLNNFLFNFPGFINENPATRLKVQADDVVMTFVAHFGKHLFIPLLVFN